MEPRMSQEAVRAGAARGPVLDVAWLGSVGYGEALTLQDEALRRDTVAHVLALVAAIEVGDPGAARTAMERHLDRVRRG